MFSGNDFELQHSKINAEKQFTAEGEIEAYRRETAQMKTSAELAAKINAAHDQDYIDKGIMYRCTCGGAYYPYERSKHEFRFHKKEKKR